MKLSPFFCIPLVYYTFANLGFSSSLETSFGCPGFETVPKNGKIAPRLNISRFPSGAVQQTGRNLVINPIIVPIHLDCWASYPIDLEFSGQLTNQRAVKVSTTVKEFTQSDDTSAHCYHITVILETYKEITGNYSCFDVQSRQLATSRFIFAQSPPSAILLRSNESVTVIVKPGQKSVIFPCAISNPAFSKDVQLLRLKGTDVQWVLESEFLKYDSKIGFIMELSGPLEKNLGLYECRISPKDVMKVTLIGPPNFAVFPVTKRILRLKRGDRLVVECLSKNEEITFRTFPELEQDQEALIDKKTLFHNRDSLSFYKNAEILVTKTFTGSSQPEVGRVDCVRKANNETLYQWQYRVSNESKKSGLLDTSSFLNSCPPPKNSSSNELDIVLFECDNWVACKMSRCLRNDPACRSNNHCVKKLCMPNGIIQCPSDTGAHSEIFFTGFNDVKYTSWRSAETKDILRILPTMQNSAHVSLMCEGTGFVVAGGFKWSLKFKDGTIVGIKRFANYTSIKETWGGSKSILRNTLTFSTDWKPILTEETTSGTVTSTSGTVTSMEIEAIICSAPVWNSTDWINQTMKFEDILTFMEHARNGTTVIVNYAVVLHPPWLWLGLTATMIGMGFSSQLLI